MTEMIRVPQAEQSEEKHWVTLKSGFNRQACLSQLCRLNVALAMLFHVIDVSCMKSGQRCGHIHRRASKNHTIIHILRLVGCG